VVDVVPAGSRAKAGRAGRNAGSASCAEVEAAQSGVAIKVSGCHLILVIGGVG
jgi:hypothetical protein